MKYVDGYVIPVSKKKVKAYLKMAKMGERMWKKFGALDYKECVGDDMKNDWGMLPFPRLAKARPGETIIFSYIVFKSKAHRNAVNKRVIKEMEKIDPQPEMPFDIKRMAYGGFNALVGG